MLRKWARLHPRDRVLLAAATFWVAAARAVLRWPAASFPGKLRALESLARLLPRLRACTPDAAAWATTAVARRVPGSACLPWALALRGLLAQAGVASELRIGVAGRSPDAIRAHAWVNCDDQTLSWGESVDGYAVFEAV